VNAPIENRTNQIFWHPSIDKVTLHGILMMTAGVEMSDLTVARGNRRLWATARRPRSRGRFLVRRRVRMGTAIDAGRYRSIPAAVAATGLSPSVVRRLVSTRRVSSLRLPGGQTRVDLEELTALVERSHVPAGPPEEAQGRDPEA
jgi:hypothetical protein